MEKKIRTPYRKELELARRATLRAAVLTKKVLASVSGISKSDATPVTIADFAAQALLISALHASFPDDKFVGEEDAGVLRTDEALRKQVWGLVSEAGEESEGDQAGADLLKPKDEEDMLDMIDLGGKGTGGREGRFWVMDPIDGTATFLRGEQYAVALALVEDGKELLGVVAYPALKLTEEGRVKENVVDDDGGLGVMLSGIKGQGAFMRNLGPGWEKEKTETWRRLLEEPAPKDTKDWHIVDSMASPSIDHDKMRQLAEELGAVYPGTDCWSSHVRYGAMILGGGDVLVRVTKTKGKISLLWDHAGAQLLFREVGGKITDRDGKEIDFGAGRDFNANRDLVAAKKEIHEKVLQMVNRIMGQ